MSPALASTTRPDIPSKRSLRSNFQRTRPGLNAGSLQILSVCAQIIQSPGVVRLMVGLGRVELPTSPLSGVRSNQLSYRPGVRLGRLMQVI
jgi:hypothetical protein